MRSVSVLVLLVFSSVTLSTSAARAEWPMPAAAAAPSPITPLVPPPARAPPIELREVFWGDRHGRVRHTLYPFQGGRVLEGADLYRVLGRDDLVRAYQSRVEAKVGLFAAGLGASVLGAIVLAQARPETQCDPAPQTSGAFQAPVCRTDWKEGTVATGIGLALLGTVLSMVAGFAIDPQPVGPAERQRLIDEFNAAPAPAAPDDGANQ